MGILTRSKKLEFKIVWTWSASFGLSYKEVVAGVSACVWVETEAHFILPRAVLFTQVHGVEPHKPKKPHKNYYN